MEVCGNRKECLGGEEFLRLDDSLEGEERGWVETEVRSEELHAIHAPRRRTLKTKLRSSLFVFTDTKNRSAS